MNGALVAATAADRLSRYVIMFVSSGAFARSFALHCIGGRLMIKIVRLKEDMVLHRHTDRQTDVDVAILSYKIAL